MMLISSTQKSVLVSVCFCKLPPLHQTADRKSKQLGDGSVLVLEFGLGLKTIF